MKTAGVMRSASADISRKAAALSGRFWAVMLGCLSGLLLVGCTGVSVSTDYDNSRQFNNLSTYAWMESKQKLVVDPLVNNDLMNRRIHRAVEASLLAQGYTKASGDESADFFVTYHVSAEDKLSVDSFHASYGYYPCWGCYGFGHRFGHETVVRQYKQGTFMVDVVDPASEQLIWRGVAGRKLNSGSPDERDAYVREIVSAILAHFPPGKKQN